MEESRDHQVVETDPHRKEEVAAAKMGGIVSLISYKQKCLLFKLYNSCKSFGFRFGDLSCGGFLNGLFHLSIKCFFHI